MQTCLATVNIRHVSLLAFQATHAGGGSGGSLRVLCNTFTGSGSLSSNGGDGKSQGGGGAGGRVYVHFTSGDFKSGHVSAHGWFALSLACKIVQLSSIQGGVYALGKAHNYALHPVSQTFRQCRLWNSSNVCLIDDGPLSSFQGRSSSAFSFHASLLLQAIDGVMSLALCPQVVSQDLCRLVRLITRSLMIIQRYLYSTFFIVRLSGRPWSCCFYVDT